MSSLLYAGRALGTLWMCLNPPEKLTSTLFKSFILLIISAGLIPLTGFFTIPSICVLIGCFISGFSRAFFSLCYCIMREFFGKSKIEQSFASIWISTSYLGDITGLVFTEILLTQAGLSWEITFSISLIIFVILDLMLFFYVK